VHIAHRNMVTMKESVYKKNGGRDAEVIVVEND
jgi:hypothetical protein